MPQRMHHKRHRCSRPSNHRSSNISSITRSISRAARSQVKQMQPEIFPSDAAARKTQVASALAKAFQGTAIQARLFPSTHHRPVVRMVSSRKRTAIRVRLLPSSNHRPVARMASSPKRLSHRPVACMLRPLRQKRFVAGFPPMFNRMSSFPSNVHHRSSLRVAPASALALQPTGSVRRLVAAIWLRLSRAFPQMALMEFALALRLDRLV